MKLVQKILSHGLLIAFLVAGFFVYMNRGDIFPQWFGAKATSAAHTDTGKTPAKPPVAQRIQPAPAPAVGANDSTAGDSVSAPAVDVAQERAAPPSVVTAPAANVPAAQTGTQAKQQPVSVPAEDSGGTGGAAAPDHVTQTGPAEPVDETVPVKPVDQARSGPLEPTQAAPAAVATDRPTDSDAADEAVAAPAQNTTAPAVTATVAEPATPAVDTVAPPAGQADVGTPPEPGHGPAAVAAPIAPHASPESIASAGQQGAAETTVAAVDSTAQQLQGELEQARQLFWKRDMRAAGNAYRALGQANPENPDVWGEIGNFYYSLRQREPAVEAYSRAVTLLVGQKDQARAQQMLGVLYKLDAGRARELEQGLLQPGH